MKKLFILAILCFSCAQRQYYPGAQKDDIKFCRLESEMVAPINRNSTYNSCMESLGYKADPKTIPVDNRHMLFESTSPDFPSY